jgi:hypothetical protein
VTEALRTTDKKAASADKSKKHHSGKSRAAATAAAAAEKAERLKKRAELLNLRPAGTDQDSAYISENGHRSAKSREEIAQAAAAATAVKMAQKRAEEDAAKLSVEKARLEEQRKHDESVRQLKAKIAAEEAKQKAAAEAKAKAEAAEAEKEREAHDATVLKHLSELDCKAHTWCNSQTKKCFCSASAPGSCPPGELWCDGSSEPARCYCAPHLQEQIDSSSNNSSSSSSSSSTDTANNGLNEPGSDTRRHSHHRNGGDQSAETDTQEGNATPTKENCAGTSKVSAAV